MSQYLARGEPVELLRLAGAIEAAHIPVLAILALRLNQGAEVPEDLRPTRSAVAGTWAAVLFFAAFAVVYGVQLAR